MLGLTLTAWLLGAAPPSTDAERKAFVARASREELTAFLRATPPEALLTLSERAIAALGTYTYVMAKQERVLGVLLEEQIIRVTARERPFAARLEYQSGPSRGRVVVYNSVTSPAQFRVKEPGLLAHAGPLWFPVDSILARADSNHSVKEAGLGNLIHRLKEEVRRASALGGITMKDEGWDKAGRYCQLHEMPQGGRGFDSALTRVCVDLWAGIPARVESFDGAGALLERYTFSELQPARATDVTFDPTGTF